MQKKILLIIAYYFPPYAGISSLRSSKFAKYLPSSGWTPWVMTVDPRYYGERQLQDDPRLTTDLAATRIIRAPYWRFPGHVIFMKLLHPLLALIFAWRHRRGISAVYLCGSPFHPFLLTFPLTGLLHIPTLLDFRDSWSINHGYDGRRPDRLRARLRQRFLGLIERISIQFSSRVVFATYQLEDEYTELFPQWREKYSTIHNGFDPADFTRIEPQRLNTGPTLIMTGQFHIYTPDAVDALMHCLSERPALHFVYVGGEQAIIEAAARRAGVENQVICLPYSPYAEVLRLTAGADVGLVSNGLINGLGTKIFDYLALGKPTLCLVPNGSIIAREFADAPSVIISHPPHTAERIAIALDRTMAMVGQAGAVDLARFDRRESTRELAGLLEAITD
ncbi:glycosyltransferase [Rhabdochromatium marinum]|uniref:glycosyltransferase n=1 Tax=Rhabdochromatium marinum TaxID=48729 RepID=UPI0019085B69|nr:glycosyltransferase [Rhabdochromatium marinum]MBK1649793.1 hypothetical protein [Rhabdochromatium marinum]